MDKRLELGTAQAWFMSTKQCSISAIFKTRLTKDGKPVNRYTATTHHKAVSRLTGSSIGSAVEHMPSPRMWGCLRDVRHRQELGPILWARSSPSFLPYPYTFFKILALLFLIAVSLPLCHLGLALLIAPLVLSTSSFAIAVRREELE